MRIKVLVLALVAGSFLLCGICEAEADAGGLKASISLPYNNSLIRADVPIFGVATGENFKQYRLEYGFGRSPKEWHVLHISDKPQPRDPWKAGLVRWSPDSGAKGNLFTWRTGLTSYTYGQQVANLNGVHTLRLVKTARHSSVSKPRAFESPCGIVSYWQALLLSVVPHLNTE